MITEKSAIYRFFREHGGPCRPVVVTIDRKWFNEIYQEARGGVDRSESDLNRVRRSVGVKPAKTNMTNWPPDPPDSFLLYGIRVWPDR